MGGRRALALVQVPRVGDVPEAPRHKKVVHHPIKGVSHPASGARDGATFDEARSSKERRKEELGAQLRRARGEERELKRRLERGAVARCQLAHTACVVSGRGRGVKSTRGGQVCQRCRRC